MRIEFKIVIGWAVASAVAIILTFMSDKYSTIIGISRLASLIIALAYYVVKTKYSQHSMETVIKVLCALCFIMFFSTPEMYAESTLRKNFFFWIYDLARLIIAMFLGWVMTRIQDIPCRIEFRILLYYFLVECAIFSVFIFSEGDIVYLAMEIFFVILSIITFLTYVFKTKYSNLQYENIFKLIISSFIMGVLIYVFSKNIYIAQYSVFAGIFLFFVYFWVIFAITMLLSKIIIIQIDKIK